MVATVRPPVRLYDQSGNPLLSRARLLDQFGNPMPTSADRAGAEVYRLRRQIAELTRAKYDAAQTVTGNVNHWANADHLDPHSANSSTVRRNLRSRSRYEVIENNPYLKGIVLTITNDFVGSGPKLQITDRRLSKDRRRLIERRWNRWGSLAKLRQKLWRLKLAKTVDGEGFARVYNNRRLRHPIQLDLHLLEGDQITSEGIFPGTKTADYNEVDGVRLDQYGNPLSYHILYNHPGQGFLLFPKFGGQWVSADYVLHWFRQDRGWTRGVPETTPSLPLCALLRRYTLAVVRAAETAAEFAAVLQTEGPASTATWTDGKGNLLEDEPFDVFPVELGMITTLPWGYTLKQLEAKQPIQTYDAFVAALLREIARPLLAPYNVAAGTSQDSNMATAVVDHHIYRAGIEQDRLHCNESLLEHLFTLWWSLAIANPDYLDDPAIAESDFLNANPSLAVDPPEHTWRWDRVGLDHTDPSKVANALKTSHDKGFLTDRQIQETYYNRDVEDWREEVAEDLEFRREVGLGSSSPSPGEATEIEEEED